jgi:hypothetical protein
VGKIDNRTTSNYSSFFWTRWATQYQFKELEDDITQEKRYFGEEYVSSNKIMK